MKSTIRTAASAFPVVALALALWAPAHASETVFVDYFGRHRTRPHSGGVGAWQQSRTADTGAAVEHFTFNPDLVQDVDGTVTFLRVNSSGNVIMDWKPDGNRIPLDWDHNRLEVVSTSRVNGGSFSTTLQFFNGSTFVSEESWVSNQIDPGEDVLENVLQFAADRGVTTADSYVLRFWGGGGAATRGFTFDSIRSLPDLIDPLDDDDNLLIPTYASAATYTDNGDGTFDFTRTHDTNLAGVAWQSASQRIPVTSSLKRIEIQPVAPVLDGTYAVWLVFRNSSGAAVQIAEVHAESRDTSLRVIENVDDHSVPLAATYELVFVISYSVHDTGSGFTFDDIRALPLAAGETDPQDDISHWTPIAASITDNADGTVSITRTGTGDSAVGLWARPGNLQIPLDADHNRVELDPVEPVAEGEYSIWLLYYNASDALLAYEQWMPPSAFTYTHTLDDLVQWSTDQGVDLTGVTGYRILVSIESGLVGSGVRLDSVAAIPAPYSGPGIYDPLDDTKNLFEAASAAANTDIVDENGHHQIASFEYPLIGMQDDADPDYLEYTVLLAKVAHIDGFMHEMVYIEDPNGNQPLSTQHMWDMLAAAETHGLTVGVNLTDGPFMSYTSWWPGHGTRPGQLQGLHEEVQAFLDQVYTHAAGAVVDGHPIMLVFGGGPDETEWGSVFGGLETPLGLHAPWFLRRADFGKTTSEINTWFDKWEVADGAFGWSGGFLNFTDAPWPSEAVGLFDRFEIGDGMEDYQDFLQQKNQEKYISGDFSFRMNSVIPRFDNRGCAGWGGTLRYMPHEDGATAQKQWDKIQVHKSVIDSVLLVTWDDHAETSAIQPTWDRGYTTLETVEAEAADFKALASDPVGLYLPERLFRIRKAKAFLDRVGVTDTTVLQTLGDSAAADISSGSYTAAAASLTTAEYEHRQLLEGVEDEPLEFSFPDPGTIGAGFTYDITFPEPAAGDLRDHHWTCMLEFQYFDDGAVEPDADDVFTITTESDRPDVTTGLTPEYYSRVAEIEKTGTGHWIKARVKVFDENSFFTPNGLNGPHIRFQANANQALDVKEITFTFTLHKVAP